MNEQRPQLHMRRTLDGLPPLVMPPGYRLRHFEPGDAEPWANLLQRNGQLGEWNLQRALPYFGPESPMPLAGAFFVLAGDEPAATAQLHLKPDGPYAPTPEVGWVAVDPSHQGRRLSVVVMLAVMHYAAAQGHHAVYLLTDDWRLPAIAIYLKLGFEPWITDSSHPERWQSVRQQLDKQAGSTTQQDDPLER